MEYWIFIKNEWKCMYAYSNFSFLEVDIILFLSNRGEWKPPNLDAFTLLSFSLMLSNRLCCIVHSSSLCLIISLCGAVISTFNLGNLFIAFLDLLIVGLTDLILSLNPFIGLRALFLFWKNLFGWGLIISLYFLNQYIRYFSNKMMNKFILI